MEVKKEINWDELTTEEIIEILTLHPRTRHIFGLNRDNINTFISFINDVLNFLAQYSVSTSAVFLDLITLPSFEQLGIKYGYNTGTAPRSLMFSVEDLWHDLNGTSKLLDPDLYVLGALYRVYLNCKKILAHRENSKIDQIEPENKEA